MLVLSRNEGESILLPNQNVRITVVRTAGGRVRLGIEAPKDVVIRRGELVDQSPSPLSEDDLADRSDPNAEGVVAA